MAKGQQNLFSLSNRIILHIDSFKIYYEEIDIVTPPKDLVQRYIALGVGAKFNQVRARLNELLRDGYILKVQTRPLGFSRAVSVYLLTEKGRKKAKRLKEEIDRLKIRVRDEHGRIYEESIGELKKRIFPFPKYNEIYLMLKREGVVDIARLRDYRRHGVKVAHLGDSPVVTRLYGRDMERIHLMDGLKSPGPSVYVVKGIAGIGKSTLVKSVVEFFLNETNIFWYTMKEGDTPGSLLRELASFLKKCGATSLENLLKAGRERPWTLDELKDALKRDLTELFAILVIDDTHHVRRDMNFIYTLKAIKEVTINSRGLKTIFITRHDVPYYSRRDEVEGHVEIIHLKELDLEAVQKLLREKGIPEEYHETIFRKLGGHPQVLELLRRDTTDFEKIPDNVTEFVVREVIEKLSPLEKTVLLQGCVLRAPASYKLFLREEHVFLAHVDLLADKSVFLRTYDGLYYVVDVVKETVKSLYPKATFNHYYDMAAEYYLEEGDAPSIIEALYYLMHRERYDDAFKAILENYELIISGGYLQELKDYIEQLESSPRELKDSADFKVIKAYTLFKFNMIKECLGTLQEVDEEAIEKVHLKADYHIIYGYVYFLQAQWHKSIEEFQTALEIAEHEKLEKSRIIALENLGMVYWKTGEIQKGKEISAKALQEAEHINDKTLKGRILLTYALIIEDAIEGPQASLPIIEEAIQCFKDAGNTYDLARAFNNLGVAMFKMGNDRKALLSWRKAYSYGTRAYNRLYKLYSQVNMADIYSKRGEYDEAMKHLKEAEKGIKEAGNKVLLPYVYLNQAIVYDNMRRYRSANESFSKAIEAVKNMGTPLNMAEIYMIYARFLWKLKKKRSARLYKRNSLQLYRKYGGEEICQKAEEELKHIK